MNCSTLQRRLLLLDSPDQPTGELAAHLAQCATCREWQRRMVQIEANLTRLPVPSSSGKARLLLRLFPQKKPAVLPIRPRRLVPRWPFVAAGLAAAVFLVTIGLLL